MNVVLIRHGKTPGNLLRRYEGRGTDTGLSEEGCAEVRAKGAALQVGEVYVSPLLRAVQTASMLFPAATQKVVCGLEEMDFGDFEGRAYEGDLQHDDAYQAWLATGCEGACPNGESRAAFCDRVCAAFEECVRDAREKGSGEVVIVAHGGTIMGVMSRYSQTKRGYFAWQPQNAQGYRARAVLQPGGGMLLADPQPVSGLDDVWGADCLREAPFGQDAGGPWRAGMPAKGRR